MVPSSENYEKQNATATIVCCTMIKVIERKYCMDIVGESRMGRLARLENFHERSL